LQKEDEGLQLRLIALDNKINFSCLSAVFKFNLLSLSTGHDESPDSLNRGIFCKMVKLLASYNTEVNEVVLENTPKNAKYTSPYVQKEILSILARKVQKSIREEIGNNKFCIMVDEARDESKKEQMAIVLRFVNKEGLIKERFLDLIHVSDTAALTLKEFICVVLSANGLSTQDIRRYKRSRLR